MDRSFESFGRIDRGKRKAIAFGDVFSRLEGPESLLAFGNGRSYGDSCHNDAGLLVPMRAHKTIISFDPHTGILEAESGAFLSEIIATVAKHGYFLPVTPGTRFVTLGGAIANDVHGKNHHLRGTFGSHVESLELLRSDGVHYICSSSENNELFAATIGGMGLTGLILNARIRLMPVGSLDVEERITPFDNLADYFAMAEEADRHNEYAVAWVDQLASGRSEGRGVLITGNHAINGNRKVNSAEASLGVPFDLPFSMLNKLSLTAFNSLYFRAKRRKQEPHLTGFAGFFYPLDGLRNWNRLYGPAGLYQHQSVIPFHEAERVIPAMLAASRSAGQASFLTVLKRFGEVHSPGLLSFPKPGYTLTMDFPNRGRKTLDLLNALDKMTVEAGGRVNPYKDQRMSSETFKASFPEWQQLEDMRDARFCSDFWRRTALKN
ncbi:FAD-binding oxidoreductase [Ochrobactrum sp. Marseille-Q0166]|uniref:FAD-binding oxidoreductase n=1 Tax=Ochrobactrum sp. Marseille-Q0166 TaxID=2761105 RepID=UPI0016566638|nr:FAD-binding oxidoreductase [Ochrobactrum sp. Marseille-Q0166]MBC8718433.1 FAD-binding oxidoreductase [Ochrobactrum sp. Marseille-Q0166]